MTGSSQDKIFSGSTPEQIREDLKPLVEFSPSPMSMDQIMGLLEERLIPHLMKYNLPGFQSMFNGFPESGALEGAGISLKFNQGVTDWQVSPGGAMLEEMCCRALCRLFGFSAGSDATFMYSGTYANQQAVYMALHRYAEKRGINFSREGILGFNDPGRLAVLVSEDAHFSLRHSIRMLGLGEESLIPLKLDEHFRLDAASLEKKISSLTKHFDVFCVVATAGTTSTGAVDPVFPLAGICNHIGAWLHVDGAYGLPYCLVPRWAPLFEGMDLADSVSWDPHKQLGIPIPNSLLFAKDRVEFDRMAVRSVYFNREEENLPNPGAKSPPSTRPFSALPLVVSLLHRGIDGLKKDLSMPLESISELASFLEKQKDFVPLHKPDTGILCFRFCPAGLPEASMDDFHQRIYRHILESGERSISISEVDEKKCLRVVAVSKGVTFSALKETVAAIRDTGEIILKDIKR